MTDKTQKKTSPKKSLIIKIVILAICLVLAAIAGKDFWELRHYKETFVASEDLTEVKWLSDYVPSLKGTWNDGPVYIFDSGVPGGTVLYEAGPHPYEPASILSAYVVLENAKVTKGRLIVIPVASMSAWTEGMCGDAYPMFYHIETEWGTKQYKIGDRYTNPLDQWPDPFTYVNYPSGQQLAYQDIRNLNRTYPGRANGTQTERAALAIVEVIRQENVDIAIDCHEAEILYPVTSTYVAPEKSLDIAMMAGMNLSATQFLMKCEASPKGLHGLSHREWADYTDAMPFLMETPEVFIDKITGPRTESLMTEGKDEFLQKATDAGLTYFPYEEDFGTPMWYRAGRHLSGALEILFWANQFDPDLGIEMTWPSYSDLEANGVGYYLHDPEAPENKDRVQYVYHEPVDKV
ncbi:MAG: deacylase [Candidatus Cloacimonetes bacterium]|nr:deacylase [Candidatus Cloacimonadota bacterium]